MTGGAGFIGTHLVEKLLESGAEVTVIDNFSRPAVPPRTLEEMGAQVHRCDIRDTDTLAELLVGAEALVHLAALIDVRESEEKPALYADVNIMGTLSVLEASRRAGVGSVVLASSAAVYGNPVRLPIDEEHPTSPISFYGLTKLVAEQVCRHYSSRGVPCTVLRLFNVYGERGRNNVVYKFLKSVHRDGYLTVYGDGEQTRDFVYVGDAVQAFLEAISRRGSGYAVYNIATGRETSINQLIQVIAEVTGKKPKVVHKPPRGEEIRRSYADTTRAQKELGFKPQTDLRTGIKRVYSWIAESEP